MNKPKNNYLFNFSSSTCGGGLRNLLSYLELFNNKGGAYFILNSSLKNELEGKVDKNELFYVDTSRIKRLWNDEYYLTSIVNELPSLKLYFSYGIPIYSRVAEVNWFHVSNLIPFEPRIVYSRPYRLAQLALLGRRVKRNVHNIDILSAESQSSLDKASTFLDNFDLTKLVLRNGVDIKQENLHIATVPKTAITIGTQKYKNLGGLYRLFKQLQAMGRAETLKIVGIENEIPSYIKNDGSVLVLGIVEHSSLIKELCSSDLFLTASRIENSSVSSLEGLCLCSESYLSSIESHLEMIREASVGYEPVDIPGVGKFYKVKAEVPYEYLKSVSWEKVRLDFYKYLKMNLIE